LIFSLWFSAGLLARRVEGPEPRIDPRPTGRPPRIVIGTARKGGPYHDPAERPLGSTAKEISPRG